MGSRAAHCHLRWDDLERTGRGSSGLRRFLSLSEGGIRAANLWAHDGFSLYLAVHPERTAGDSLGLRRFFTISEVSLASNEPMGFRRRHRRCGLAYNRLALSQDFG